MELNLNHWKIHIHNLVKSVDWLRRTVVMLLSCIICFWSTRTVSYIVRVLNREKENAYPIFSVYTYPIHFPGLIWAPLVHHVSAIVLEIFFIVPIGDNLNSSNKIMRHELLPVMERSILMLFLKRKKMKKFLRRPWYGGQLNYQYTLLHWFLSQWVSDFLSGVSTKIVWDFAFYLCCLIVIG